MADRDFVANLSKILQQRLFGSGNFGSVYAHPDDPTKVIKIPHNIQDEELTFKPFHNKMSEKGIKAMPTHVADLGGEFIPAERPNASYDMNYGQPYDRNAYVMNKVEGKPLLPLESRVSVPRTHMPFVRTVNELRKIPPESFARLRSDIKGFIDNGYPVDMNGNNFLLDKQNKQINMIDVPLSRNAPGQPTWSGAKLYLDNLLDPEKAIKYNSAPTRLPPDSSPIDIYNKLSPMLERKPLTPMKQSAISKMIDIASRNYGIARKIVPALGIPDMLRTGERVSRVVRGITSPLEEYSDMLGIQTYNPMQDYQ